MKEFWFTGAPFFDCQCPFHNYPNSKKCATSSVILTSSALSYFQAHGDVSKNCLNGRPFRQSEQGRFEGEDNPGLASVTHRLVFLRCLPKTDEKRTVYR
mmetsp:Transcript_17232/g.35697  ORF Transcript_17232/g.35697 Transcript_17232/m.35697 type:complete len:99 (+) Transcript_17232:1710-2006(+)